jgi:hypothetical protein
LANGGTLTFNGGSIVTTCCGIYNQGTLTVNGGTISAEGDPNYPDYPGSAIENYSSLTVSGGRIENSGIGIESYESDITMTTLPTFSGNDIDIYLSGDAFITFNSNITTAPITPVKVSVSYTSCAFTTNYSTYCSNIHPTQMFQYADDGNYAFVALNTQGEALKISGYQLLDGIDNSSTITEWVGETAGVQLYGRTFYRNGDWNTLCLPFSLTNDQISMSNLIGAEIKELDTNI